VARAKEFEQRLERAEAQLRLCQRLSRHLAKQSPLGESLAAIVRMVAEYLHADSCLLYLISGNDLVLCAAHGPNPGAVGEVRLNLAEGLTGWVARERRLLAISREAYHDPRFKFFRDLPEDKFEAFLSAPVLSRHRVVGVINIQHRQPHAHSGDEMEMLTTAGEQIGALAALAGLDADGRHRDGYADLVLTGQEANPR